jgi:hypothetical protein
MPQPRISVTDDDYQCGQDATGLLSTRRREWLRNQGDVGPVRDCFQRAQQHCLKLDILCFRTPFKSPILPFTHGRNSSTRRRRTSRRTDLHFTSRQSLDGYWGQEEQSDWLCLFGFPRNFSRERTRSMWLANPATGATTAELEPRHRARKPSPAGAETEYTQRTAAQNSPTSTRRAALENARRGGPVRDFKSAEARA